MIKYNFQNDYSEGCHQSILDLLTKTNLEQHGDYGDDYYSIEAKQFINNKIKNDDVEIYFVSGGTQANLIVISSLLKPHESVIAANTGHINVHEAGAIEATGHKINIVKSEDGKITIEDIQEVLDEHLLAPHMVKPKMVYISNSTEIGTIYKKDELRKISDFCKTKNLFLFLDGARLGSALSAIDNDLSLSDISKLTDIFYIGGTKNGALLGEAIVINNKMLHEDFAYYIKQKGALMSKGKVLGIQFYALFKENLFFDLAKHANKLSAKISKAFEDRGTQFLIKSTSNQIFPILPNKLITELNKKYGFFIWEKINEENSAIRIVTSWATSEESVNEFISDLINF